MHEVQNPPSHEDTKTTMSIADELSKLAKLKEQGEWEFDHLCDKTKHVMVQNTKKL